MRETLHLLVDSPKQLGLGQAKAKRPELYLVVPSGQQGPNHLSHHLLPPKTDTGRWLGSREELGLEPGTSNPAPKAHPQSSQSSVTS